MSESNVILDNVKQLLNIEHDTHEFDRDILASINSSFFTLYQLGVGPSDEPFHCGLETTWNSFETSVPKDVVLDYLHLTTSLVFDPPTISSVLDAYKNRIMDLEFRMNIYVDDGGGNVTG